MEVKQAFQPFPPPLFNLSYFGLFFLFSSGPDKVCSFEAFCSLVPILLSQVESVKLRAEMGKMKDKMIAEVGCRLE